MNGDVVRELLVRLGVLVDDPDEVRQFDEDVERAKINLGELLNAAKWAAAGIAAFTGALVAQTAATARHTETVVRQADALSATTDEYQELLHAFETLDADSGDLADALNTLVDRAEDAKAGTASMVEDFALIGIGIDDIRGKRSVELFELMADGVANTADAGKGAAAAVRIFGDDVGRKLLPMLRQGKAGVDALRQEAHELGVVLDGEALAAGQEFAAQTRRMWSALRGVRNEIGVALIPIVGDLVDGILGWVQANRALLRQGIEVWAGRLERAFVAVGDRLRVVDDFVRTRLGGWGRVLAATGFIGGQLAIAGVFYKILPAVRVVTPYVRQIGAALSGVAAAAGTTTGAVAALAAAALASVLIWEDLWVTIRGGDSVTRRFIDSWSDADSVLGGVARVLEQLARSAGLAVQAVGNTAAWATDGIQSYASWLGDLVVRFLRLEKVVERAKKGVSDFFEGVSVQGALDAAAGFFEARNDDIERTVSQGGGYGSGLAASFGGIVRDGASMLGLGGGVGGASPTTTVGDTNITVYGAGGDPQETARAVGAELERSQRSFTGGGR